MTLPAQAKPATKEFRLEPGDVLYCSPDVADSLRRAMGQGDLRLAGVPIYVSKYLSPGTAVRINPKQMQPDFGGMMFSSPRADDEQPAPPQNPAPSAGPGE